MKTSAGCTGSRGKVVHPYSESSRDSNRLSNPLYNRSTDIYMLLRLRSRWLHVHQALSNPSHLPPPHCLDSFGERCLESPLKLYHGYLHAFLGRSKLSGMEQSAHSSPPPYYHFQVNSYHGPRYTHLLEKSISKWIDHSRCRYVARQKVKLKCSMFIFVAFLFFARV